MEDSSINKWENDEEYRLVSSWELYDKRDDLYFPIMNFPFICSNIPAAPTYRGRTKSIKKQEKTHLYIINVVNVYK